MKKGLLAIASLVLALGLVHNAQAVTIGDPNVLVNNGTLTVQTNSTGVYSNLFSLTGTVDPGNGATRMTLGNPASSFQFNAYGSTAPGTLQGSAGFFGYGTRALFGAGSGGAVAIFANGDYGNPNGHLYIATSGKVGIGTSTPAANLDVVTAATGFTQVMRMRGAVDPGYGGTQMEVSNTQSLVALSAYGSAAPGVLANSGAIIGTAGTGGSMLIGGAPNTKLVFFANNAYGTGHMMIDNAGNVGIGTSSPATKLDVAGEASVNVINIRGGSDLSEQFNIQAQGKVEPGMVVSIDPKHAGELVICSKAYDRTVAGIISGAGGVKPGMIMGQNQTLAYGKYPVALTGRVYCYVDATKGAVEPGDMLTTSDTPGHAMKVTSHDKANGAIIGKAMTALPSGRGLVLVLVGLQ